MSCQLERMPQRKKIKMIKYYFISIAIKTYFQNHPYPKTSQQP